MPPSPTDKKCTMGRRGAVPYGCKTTCRQAHFTEVVDFTYRMINFTLHSKISLAYRRPEKTNFIIKKIPDFARAPWIQVSFFIAAFRLCNSLFDYSTVKVSAMRLIINVFTPPHRFLAMNFYIRLSDPENMYHSRFAKD